MFWGILIIIAGIVSGIHVCRYGATRTLKIEFEYSPLNWILVTFFALLSVLLAFVLDLVFSQWICNLIGEKSGYLHLIKKFLENGLLIPFLSALVSYLFKIKVESLHMQYLKLYSETVPKVCFSVLVVSFCIVVQFLIIPHSEGNQAQVEFWLNRILMWIITVIGTWVGFGFACKESTEIDNQLIRDNNNGIFWREKIKFWIPILAALMFCDVILFVAASKLAGVFAVIVTVFAFAFLVSGLLSAFFIKRKINPSPRRSLKLFLKARNNLGEGIPANGQYGRVQYELFENELRIKPREVIYEGHQDDEAFKALFGGPTIKFNDFREAFEKLEELDKAQKEYIQKGFDDCVEIERKKKREKIE